MSQLTKHRVILKPVRGKGSIKGYGDGSVLFNYNSDRVYTEVVAEKPFTQYYELYIISDEIPKLHDWYYNPKTEQLPPPMPKNIYYRSVAIEGFHDHCKKIIATTNEDIQGYDGSIRNLNNIKIPGIPEWFIQHYIERYNRKDVIEEVLIDPNTLVHGTIGIELIKETWSREEVIDLIHNVLKYMVRNFDESGALNALISKTETSKTIKPN